jgi:hypothetical protein
MRQCGIFFLVLLTAFSYTLSQGRETGPPEFSRLIEIDAENGRILIFPDFLPGPEGPILKFLMFGIEEPPEVILRTDKGLVSAQVTTISFNKGHRFSGWVAAPEEEVISIWINGWFVEWRDSRWQ